MFVHCCHCHDCQRLSGSAYAINGMVETHALSVEGSVRVVQVPTPSGNGQEIHRCASCGTAIFSHYLIRDRRMAFLRVGTLDDPSLCPPDVQIFTESKQPWVPLRDDLPVFEKFYTIKDVWPADAYARRMQVTDEGR